MQRTAALSVICLLLIGCQPFGLWRLSSSYRDISQSRTMYLAAQWNPQFEIIAAAVRENNQLVPWGWLLNSDELVLLDGNGSRLRGLLRPPASGVAQIDGVGWTADGRFALCQVREIDPANGRVKMELWLVDVTTGSTWQVEAPGLPPSVRLSMSPDGRFVSGWGFLWDTGDGKVEIYSDRRLTVFSAHNRVAVLQGDVLYVGDDALGLVPIYRGSEDPPIELGDVVWSPDGTMLAVSVGYTSDAFHNEVVLLRPDGNVPYILATGLSISSLSWSPDGREILGISSGVVSRRLVRLPLPVGVVAGPATSTGMLPPPKQLSANEGLLLPRWLPEGVDARPLVQEYPESPYGRLASPWPWAKPHVSLLYSTAFTRSLEIDEFRSPPVGWKDAPRGYLGAAEEVLPLPTGPAYAAVLERTYPPRTLAGGEGKMLEGRLRTRIGDAYIVVRWRGFSLDEIVKLTSSMVR